MVNVLKYVKIVLLVCAFLITNLMTGCDDGKPKNFFTDAEFPEQKIAENVTVTAEFSEYDKDVEKISFMVTNNGDKEFVTGEDFRMQKMEDGEWHNVAVTGKFNLLARAFEPGKTSTYTAELKDHVKLPLPAGQYRIGIGYEKYPQERDVIAYGEFTVK